MSLANGANYCVNMYRDLIQMVITTIPLRICEQSNIDSSRHNINKILFKI